MPPRSHDSCGEITVYKIYSHIMCDIVFISRTVQKLERCKYAEVIYPPPHPVAGVHRPYSVASMRMKNSKHSMSSIVSQYIVDKLTENLLLFSHVGRTKLHTLMRQKPALQWLEKIISRLTGVTLWPRLSVNQFRIPQARESRTEFLINNVKLSEQYWN